MYYLNKQNTKKTNPKNVILKHTFFVRQVMFLLLASLCCFYGCLGVFADLKEPEDFNEKSSRGSITQSAQKKDKELNNLNDTSFTGNITILFTNNINGKMEPCGCSGVKNGGFAFLGTYLKKVRDKSSNVILLDGGDFIGKKVFPFKTKTFLEIMSALGYTSIVPGEEEYPYLEDIYKYSKVPVVFNNAAKNKSKYFSKVILDKWKNKINVRIWGAVDPAFLSDRGLSSEASFGPKKEKLKKKGFLDILVLHSGLNGARRVARKKMGYDIIIASHEGPSLANPIRIGGAYILRVDHQGLYVGRADIAIDSGLIRDADLEVEVISGRDGENEDIQDMILEYRSSLEKTKALSYFADKKSLKDGLRFVGDKSCKTCHKKNFANWKKTKHAKAFSSLEGEVQDHNPDCVTCHTLGYGFISGFKNKTPHMVNVQCENCHGAGSLHMEGPKENKLTIPTENVCLECHTDQRDSYFEFETDVKKIGCNS